MPVDDDTSMYVWLDSIGNAERWKQCILPKMAVGVTVGTAVGALVDVALLGTDLGAGTGIGAVGGAVWGLWKGLTTCPTPNGYGARSDVSRFVEHMRANYGIGAGDARDLLALGARFSTVETACMSRPELKARLQLLMQS